VPESASWIQVNDRSWSVPKALRITHRHLKHFDNLGRPCPFISDEADRFVTIGQHDLHLVHFFGDFYVIRKEHGHNEINMRHGISHANTINYILKYRFPPLTPEVPLSASHPSGDPGCSGNQTPYRK
jgi:hypothetical protein